MDAKTRVIAALAGGAAALVIGTQVAGAQESPSPSSPPSTQSPAPDGSESPDAGRRGRGNREDCPDKDKNGVPDDQESGQGSSTDTTSL